jgi:hypothetical protein
MAKPNIYLVDSGGSELKKPRTTRAKKGRYHYPKSLLSQEYFCRGGDGTWHKPRFTLRTLGNENFNSPIGALLDQLESEGHNVKGARVEWLAFRDLAKQYDDLIFNLSSKGLVSTVATHLYDCSDGRQS